MAVTGFPGKAGNIAIDDVYPTTDIANGALLAMWRPTTRDEGAGTNVQHAEPRRSEETKVATEKEERPTPCCR